MKLNHYLLMLCMSLLLFSCKNENEPSGELITVKLSTSFLQLTDDSDKPMLVKSAVDPAQVIYAVQVYENDIEYYYGLFDKADSMKIALMTGKNYRFKVVSYKVGTGNGLKQDVQPEGKYFYLPNKTLLENKFIKGNALKDINLTSSAKLTNTLVKDYPEIDAFYCDKSVTVEKGLNNIDFSLLRMGFSVTYKVDGLSNGKLFISIGNDTTTLTSGVTTSTSIHLFNSTNGDFTTIFANANSYADSILVKAQWIGSNGTILNTQGKFKFMRNYLKTINIQLNTSNANLSFEDWNTVSDVDGNVYKTITIGTQTWMAENLKVTHFRDGSLIPNVTSASSWTALTTGAYCDYNNTPANSTTFGRLYNWYAATDSHNIAPIGWHVPSDAEWTTLNNYVSANLGTSTTVGKAFAATTNWNISSNLGAIGNDLTKNNSTGFKALPSGVRVSGTNDFDGIGTYCHWWSITQTSTTNAWKRGLGYDTNYQSKDDLSKKQGSSIRCIKD